jgi:hypothetical protein
VVVVSVFAPTATARRIRSPALGNWEGAGPHGLPLSFRFVRSNRHVDVRDLVIGFGLSCPAKRSNAEAVANKAGYIGPGRPSPFLHLLKIPANGFLINLQGAMTQGSTLEGRLKSRRQGKLWMSAPRNTPRCWPRKTDRWRIRRRTRRVVRDGPWSGSVTQTGAPSVSGTVTISVTAGGRELNYFSLSYRCGPEGGGGGITTPAYGFIDAGGGFAGPATPQSVNGVPTTWSAHFGADGVLRGTFSNADQCSPTTASTPVTLAFTARHS